MARKIRDWGRIRQLKSGRWQARYPSPDGILRPALNTFTTRKEAARWLADKQTEIVQSDWVDPDAGKVRFMEYAATWIKERDLSDTTRERYEIIHRNHFAAFSTALMVDIREAAIRRWRSDLIAKGTGAPTVAKAYRLLHSIFTTAVDDRMVKRNPCHIKGASKETSPERHVLDVQQVYAVANVVSPRYRMLILMASFTTLRFGELAALRRRDVNLTVGEVYVRHSQAELRDGRLLIKEPKSEAGKRTVAIPKVIIEEMQNHIDNYSEHGADGRIFVGQRGGHLRRRNFRRLWNKALREANLSEDVHFHDLRHTGNHLAATNGATTKELMARMGHSTMRAALIYQHATRERDHAIAAAMSRVVKDSLENDDSLKESQ